MTAATFCVRRPFQLFFVSDWFTHSFDRNCDKNGDDENHNAGEDDEDAEDGDDVEELKYGAYSSGPRLYYIALNLNSKSITMRMGTIMIELWWWQDDPDIDDDSNNSHSFIHSCGVWSLGSESNGTHRTNKLSRSKPSRLYIANNQSPSSQLRCDNDMI